METRLVIWEPQELFREGPLLPAGGSVGVWGPGDTCDVSHPEPEAHWLWGAAAEFKFCTVRQAFWAAAGEWLLWDPSSRTSLRFWPCGKKRVRPFHHLILKMTLTLEFKNMKYEHVTRHWFPEEDGEELSLSKTYSYFCFLGSLSQ